MNGMDTDSELAERPQRRRTVISLLFGLGFVAALLCGPSVPSKFHYPVIQEGRTASVPPIDELQSYLRFAYAAFCPTETLLNWTCPWCLEKDFHTTAILYNETTQTRGFVGYLPQQNLIIASFRGSEGNANWILDLVPGVTHDFYGVTIRKGWWEAYEALRGQLLEGLHQIHQECPSCSSFVTTGHSLGAAISGLAALDVKLELPWMETTGMRNFGMPRVGYQDFAELFETHVDSSFRVVHFRDIVPHYPLRRHGMFPYHHVATELWEPLEQFNGTLEHCNGGEDSHCSNSVPMWHWSSGDHMTYLGIQNDNCGT